MGTNLIDGREQGAARASGDKNFSGKSRVANTAVLSAKNKAVNDRVAPYSKLLEKEVL